MNTYTLAVCFLVTVTVPSIYSFCFSGQPVASFTKGVFSVTCSTMHGDMKPGETLTKDCVQCHCTHASFSCCGVGYKAGVVAFEGCEMKAYDNCCFQMINSTHPTQNCTDLMC